MEKLYRLEVFDENDLKSKPKRKELLLWKKGLISLEDGSQLRVKPKGVHYQDPEMFTLGNSEVIARGNHLWIRRKHNRCSSVEGTMGDSSLRIVNLRVYSLN